MRNSHRARLRPRQASAIGIAALFLLGVNPTGAHAADASPAARDGSYDIHVTSSGLAVQFHDPSLPLQPDVMAGPYSALAVLDNLGRSQAQAGAPFLGDYVGPLFGHFNGLGAGEIPPFPPVPGEVRSSYPGQPTAAQRNHGYAIEATSDESESTAAVNMGVSAPGSQDATLFSVAHAMVDHHGVLSAVGRAGAGLLDIGPLSVGKVASSVTMSQSASGAAAYVTSTDVGTITVSGQKFGLDQSGLTFAGTNSGASATQLNDAAKALEASGLSIRYLPSTVTHVPGTQTVESVQSGAVEVSYEREVPSRGLVRSTYTLGRVEISATSQNVAAAEPPPAAPAPAPGSRTGSGDAAMLPTAKAPTAATTGSPAAAQDGEPDPVPDDQSVAIVTPTLKMMRFGSVLGLPDGCNIVAGSMGAGATELGVGDQAGPVLAQGVEQCTTFGLAGGEHLTAGMAAVAPLAVINPAFDPGIDAFADALETVGRDHSESVAPFGPTIVGMAQSARFFKGCRTC